MNDISGLSLIIGQGIFYIGSYKKGIWYDNCALLKLPKEQRTGFGFKIDLCFSNTVRPIGLFWDKEFWNNEELRIIDIPSWQWDEFFGIRLAGKLRRLQAIDPTRLFHGAFNPWYGRRWFVLRLPKWMFIFSFSTLVGLFLATHSWLLTALSFFIMLNTGFLPIFISVGLGELFSFYIGSKTYKVDVLTRDLTWVNKKDVERAKRATPTNSYYALCPSFTFRRTRQT